MIRSAALLPAALHFVLMASLAGCGGSMTPGGARQMQSVMVTPAAADAQNSPGGKVQFTASGNFNMAPMTVSPLAVSWSIGNPPMMPPMSMSASQSMPGGATIDANGLAQCNGFMGMVTVQATAPANPSMPLSQMGTMTMNVMGQAQMTCP